VDLAARQRGAAWPGMVPHPIEWCSHSMWPERSRSSPRSFYSSWASRGRC